MELFCLFAVINLHYLSLNQSLKKISKFVDTNILPGATAEVGLLCCAFVHSDPEAAGLHLIKLILKKIISSLNGTPITGYVERAASSGASSSKKVC
jgi:proteasome activator subunit 4